jgi:hypothetical protein
MGQGKAGRRGVIVGLACALAAGVIALGIAAKDSAPDLSAAANPTTAEQEANSTTTGNSNRHHPQPLPAGCHLTMETDGYDSGYAGSSGTTSLQARFKDEGASPCSLDSTLQLVLLGQDGQPVPVSGNPGSVQIARRLASRQELTAEWIWANYCGPKGPFSVQATFGQLHTSGRVQGHPFCGDLGNYPSGFSEPKVRYGLLP